MEIKFKITLILVFIFTGLCGFNTNAANLEIERIVQNAVDNGHFNGAVLVAEDGELIYQQAFGYANGNKTEKLTVDHRFNIGSISKEFPAVALSMLLHENNISIERPLADFVNNLPAWAKTIQLKHLVNYSSGLPDFPWAVNVTDEDAIKFLNSMPELKSLAGTNYHYSYFNNFLMALVIEKLSSTPFELYLQTHIFTPLQMLNTENNLNIPNSLLPTAKAFGSDGKEDDFPVFVTGPSIYTTVNDLFKWAVAIQNNVMFDLTRFNALAKPLSPETNGDLFSQQQSAFGNIKYSGDEVSIIFHNGSHFNFHSVLYSDKSHKRVVIILSNNKANSKIYDIGNSIIELLDSDLGLI